MDRRVADRQVVDLRVGCCGFPLSQGEYFRRYPSVEVQQTFYHPPKVETAARWREAAPASFEFAVKAWQLITHPPSSPTYRRLRKLVPEERREYYGSFRPTQEVQEAWEVVAALARTLRTGIILFQTPASFRPSAEHRRNLRRFFRKIKREGFRFVWEPRGEWAAEEVLSLCSECDLLPGGDPFAGGLYPGKWAYFRLHGGMGYRGRYGESKFAQLFAWARERERTYVFFNNLAMAEDCSRFLAWLKERG